MVKLQPLEKPVKKRAPRRQLAQGVAHLAPRYLAFPLEEGQEKRVEFAARQVNAGRKERHGKR